MDALAEALTLACPQGYVRVFADEGPPMAALLARLIAAQRSGGAAAEVPLGCLARLQRALAAQNVALDAGRRSVTAVPGLVEQLTSRELEVLEMLAAGRSNQAIASQLVVTLNTVKKHVGHVLGKLGAANRTEAVRPRTRAQPDSLTRSDAAPPPPSAPWCHRRLRRFHRACPLSGDARHLRFLLPSWQDLLPMRIQARYRDPRTRH